jgi:hypothetical protein
VGRKWNCVCGLIKIGKCNVGVVVKFIKAWAKMNPSDYEIMMRIFQKLGVDKNFFGEFIFVFSGGNFVQVRDNRVKKPDDVKKLLSQ